MDCIWYSSSAIGLGAPKDAHEVTHDSLTSLFPPVCAGPKGLPIEALTGHSPTLEDIVAECCETYKLIHNALLYARSPHQHMGNCRKTEFCIQGVCLGILHNWATAAVIIISLIPLELSLIKVVGEWNEILQFMPVPGHHRVVTCPLLLQGMLPEICKSSLALFAQH